MTKKIHEISDDAGYLRITEEQDESDESHDYPPCLTIRMGFHGEDDHNTMSFFEDDAEFVEGVIHGWLMKRRQAR